MSKRFPPIALLLALLGALLIAPSTTATSPDHSWRTFDHLDGVDANWIFDSAQTPDGALWFATDQGVLRFDGAWEKQNEGLPDQTALALAVDANGGLWVGTGRGVARRQDDGWIAQGAGTELEQARINTLLAMPNGEVWAGGDTGVFVWSPVQGWRRLGGTPLPGADVLARDASGGIWMAQAGKLFRFDSAGWREVLLAGANASDALTITDLAADADGGMWAATQAHGVAHLTDKEIVWETTVGGLSNDQTLALYPARDGSLWVGTNGGGVGRLGPDGWEVLTIQDGLAANFVSSLIEDKDRVLWFGTVAGVTRYDAHTWQTWIDDPHAPQGLVAALAATHDGRVWAAVQDDGLYRLENDVWQKMTVQANGRPIPLRSIETMFVDEAGNLWIGDQNEGVVHLTSDKVQHFTKANGLPQNFITAIAQTTDGAMWFGSASSGLSRWNGNHWRRYSQADGLQSEEITALLGTPDGALWVGSRAGLGRYAEDGWQWFTTDDGLASNEITALAVDDEGGVWAATWGGGVCYWQQEAWRTFDARNSLLPPGVEALLAQPGKMWMGAVSGLSVYDGRSWQHFSHAYGYDVGRVYALAADASGAVFVGGDTGVVRYAPESSPPLLQALSINGQTPQAGEKNILSGSEVHIVLHGQDTLSGPDDLVYLYRIAGIDDHWRQGRSETIIYPPLPVGDYTFQAQVRDAAMNYSQPLSLILHVRRTSAFLWLPGVGRVRSGFALLGVIFLTLFAALVGYISWNTALRWHARRQAVGRRFNPYIAGSPIRSPEMFYGRSDLIQNIKASLANNSLMIHGERRIGKTSLLYRLMDELRHWQDDKLQFFPIFVDLEGVLEQQFHHQLMEGLLDALHHDLRDFPAEQKLQYHQTSDDMTYSDRHMRRDLRQIVSFLKKHCDRTPRIIFLLDEADVLSTYSSLTQQQFRRTLQDVFARNVGVVIAGVHISKAWDRVESPWYNMFVEVVATPLSRDEAEALMREPVRGVYDWEDVAIEFVWRRSQGRPHRIQQIAREAVDIMLDEKRRRIALQDVRRAYNRIAFAEKY